MEKSPIIDVAKKCSPAVINIVISKDMPKLDGFYMVPFGGKEFIMPKIDKGKKEKVEVGGGSGFIISPDGLVITNRHVIADPEAEYVAILDHNQRSAIKILARDPVHDLAILKLKTKKKNLPYLELGDSGELQLGQTVVAIGNALGEFRNTISTGVVSGLSRFISAASGLARQAERLRGLIQTDAAINPGNSGGPLVDIEGKAIGINVAMVFGAQNIGFAIPINHVKKDLEEVKKYGHIRLPFLGIRYIIINKAIQKQNKLPANHGALIIRETLGETAVVPGSNAEKAGLREFDIILECDKEKITEDNTIQDILQKHEIGNELTFKVLRDKKEFSVKIKLEEKK